MESKRSTKKREYWTPEEDQVLRDAVEANGARNWAEVAKLLPRRSAKQCNERYAFQQDRDHVYYSGHSITGPHNCSGCRWTHHLASGADKREFSALEDALLVRALEVSVQYLNCPLHDVL